MSEQPTTQQENLADFIDPEFSPFQESDRQDDDSTDALPVPEEGDDR